jgi:hypothetical protein
MRAILAILMLVLPGTALAQAADPDATFVLAADASAGTIAIDATVPLSLGVALDGADDSLESQEPALFAGAAVAETVLADTHGRAQVNWLHAISESTAIVANNKVGDNSVTGAVSVADNAFQNVSGIAMVNFNTGNNSSINAGMSVNLLINYAQPGQ